MFFGTLACHLRYALIIVIIVLVVVLLSKWTGSGASTVNVRVVEEQATLKAARSMVKESQESASKIERGAHPLMQLVQAVYAQAYLEAAQSLASDKDLSKQCKLNVQEYCAKLQAKQEEAVALLLQPPPPTSFTPHLPPMPVMP
jgi:hypothetical protein